jgi:hypothetical protein
MGDPSSLRLVPASSASIPIDWDRVPEASKKFLLRGWRCEQGLPATVGDLANVLDDSKFFGYFGPSLCTLLMDISEFGLQAAAGRGTQVGPRFYMKYLEQVWFILFMPGKRDCISGYSHDIIERYDDEYDDEEEEKNDDDGEEEKNNNENNDDGEEEKNNDENNNDENEYARYEEEEKRMVAEEVEIAQKFDLKLTQEVSKGAAEFVDITKKLGGWESTMLHDDLELAQYFEAVRTLPMSHPAHQDMMERVMSSIRRGSS